MTLEPPEVLDSKSEVLARKQDDHGKPNGSPE